MGRSTKGYIRHQDVDISHIADIVNSDIGKLPLKDVNFGKIFDNIVETEKSDLYGAFINGDGEDNVAPATRDISTDYNSIDPPVPGESDSEKLDNVITQSTGYDLGDLRGYGGVETTDGLPIIYWNNIIDKYGIENVPLNNPTLCTVVIHPDIDEYGGMSESKRLFLNNSDINLNDSNLATRIGIDYPTGEQGLPEFQIKVTAGILDLESTSEGFGIDSINSSLALLTRLEEIAIDSTSNLAFTMSFFGILRELSNFVIEVNAEGTIWGQGNVRLSQLSRLKLEWNEVAEQFDVVGYYDKTGVYHDYPPANLSGYEPTGTEVVTIPTGSGAAQFWVQVQELLGPIQFIASLMIRADELWDKFTPQSFEESAIYEYFNTVAGMYRFEDIEESTYTIGFADSKYTLTNLVETNNITIEGTTHDYTLDTFNNSTLYSSVNQIPIFPNEKNTVQRYMNMDFFPKCVQYDLDTPPPIILYKVELIALKNCRLPFQNGAPGEDKLTEFTVMISPTSFIYPEYSIESPFMEDGIPVLYKNSNITFKNARYCDFVYCADTIKGPNLLPDNIISDLIVPEILDQFVDKGFLTTFYNISLGRDAFNYRFMTIGESLLYDLTVLTSISYYPPYQGNDINLIPMALTNNTGDLEETDRPFYADGTVNNLYNVYFMQEEFPNELYNPKFRVEQDNVNVHLRKYWNYSSNATITGSSIKVTSGASGFISQVVAKNDGLVPNSFYTLKIGLLINSGTISLYDYCFENGIYAKSMSALVTERDVLPEETATATYNVRYGTNGVEFYQSGDYYIVVKTKSSLNDVFMLLYDSAFDGDISYCNLQYLPQQPAGNPEDFTIPVELPGLGTVFNVPIAKAVGRGCYDARTFGSISSPTLQFKYINSLIVSKTLFLKFDPYKGSSIDVYSFKFELAPYKKANITFYTEVNVVGSTFTYTNDTTASQIITFAETLPYSKYCNLQIEDTYPNPLGIPEFNNSLYHIITLPYFECSDIKLIGICDAYGLLQDGVVKLDGTSLLALFQIIYERGFAIKGSTEMAPTHSKKSFTTPLNSLNLSDLNLSGNVKNYLPTVNNYLNINNTKLSGNLIDLLTPKQEGLLVTNTNINKVGLGQPSYTVSTQPFIVWKDSRIPIAVTELNLLLKILDDTNTYNGYLDISGANPDIVSTTALGHINSLVGTKNWNILFNINGTQVDTSTPPTIELIDGNITLYVGESYVELGATAIDCLGNDISDDIVITGYVGTTVGAYNIEYNVTDSFGNAATEVVRTVNVIQSTPQFEEVTIGTQTWMLRNLDIDDGGGGIYAYGNNEANVATYGKLYTWDAAMRVAASIDGWHLPSRAEFETLMLFYGDTLSSDEYGVFYTNPPVGLDRVGGGRASITDNPPFDYLNEIWAMWAIDTSIAGWDIFSETEEYYYVQYDVTTDNGYSVRLIKD